MKCFMFPGQPLAVGDNLPDDADANHIRKLVCDRTGFDLESFNWLGKGSTDSTGLQLYGVAMSLYRLRRLQREGVRPDFVAEHSMGIYPALAACGSISEEAAIDLTWRVGECMARFGAAREYLFGCVTGLTLEPLLAIAGNHRIFMANYNTSRMFLLSGERHQIEEAMLEALDAGAFSAKTFPCDAPLHTPLMEEVEEDLRAIFADYRYGEPTCRLLDHFNQDYLTAADMYDFLYLELLRPVYWEKSYRALRAAGAGVFIEVGAGDALRKYNRWIDSELNP